LPSPRLGITRPLTMLPPPPPPPGQFPATSARLGESLVLLSATSPGRWESSREQDSQQRQGQGLPSPGSSVSLRAAGPGSRWGASAGLGARTAATLGHSGRSSSLQDDRHHRRRGGTAKRRASGRLADGSRTASGAAGYGGQGGQWKGRRAHTGPPPTKPMTSRVRSRCPGTGRRPHARAISL